MRLRGLLAAALCATALGGGVPVAGQAAAPEPDTVISTPLTNPLGGSTLDLESPCGVAVAAPSRFYVANHYPNRIDWINPLSLGFGTQLVNVDPLGGPCGLALDGLGRIYVNNYHRSVERYSLSGGIDQAPLVVDSSHPTGVAVDRATDGVYVNARTHLNVYDSTGVPVMDGSDPLRIGQGSLGDGYGLAVSAYPTTAGHVYVPDWSDDTVKVYDPAVDKDDPVQVISGPPGGFGSLRDSAVAVDDFSGEVYVADTRAYPQYSEKPEATVYVFEIDGTYKGRLKYNVIDSSPVGLAVDNTEDDDPETVGVPGPDQGRVYVTSGNTVGASVYLYPPDSATTNSAPPLGAMGKAVVGGGDPPPTTGKESSAEGTTAPSRSTATSSVIAEKGDLRVSVSGKLTPKRLPRQGTAPIAVTVGGEITTTDQSLPPQLRRMRIELNREGRLDTVGLPSCVYDRIQPGSSQRALSACGPSLVGRGSFTANITLAGQEPYPTSGKLLVFHSVENGRPVLYGHIYSPRPFATSFVIVFKVQDLGEGTYGTALDAPLPRAMDAWGRLTGLRMNLSRRYSHKGKKHSFLSAGCPAPKGFSGAVFSLARTEFSFAGGSKLRSTLTSQCKARG